MCNPAGGSATPTTLNLEEHVANYNGHMLSNLTGAVEIPSSPAVFPVPTDFNWKVVSGPTGCYYDHSDPDYPPMEDDTCVPRPSDGTDPATCDGPWGVDIVSAVEPGCFYNHWPIGWPYYYTWLAARGHGAENGWEFSMYDNVHCEGEVIGTIEAGKGSAGVCKVLPAFAVGVKVTPKWNWD